MAGVVWSFDETAGRFSDYLLSCGKQPRTARTYSANLRVWWRWCLVHDTTPEDATSEHVRAYFLERQGEGVSSTRRSSDKYALTHYYAWLSEDGRREESPVPASLRIKREQVEPTAPLAVAELERLLAACERPRDRLLLLIPLTTGMRITEIETMAAEDVDWSSGRVLIHGKGAKERVALLPGYVLEELRLYVGLIDRDGNAVRSGRLWRSVSTGRPMTAHTIRDKVLAAVAQKAGVEGFRPHRLRATFATLFQEQYGDIETLMDLMGHASPATTTRYSGSTKRARALRQAAGLEISKRLARAGRRQGLLSRLFGRGVAAL